MNFQHQHYYDKQELNGLSTALEKMILLLMLMLIMMVLQLVNLY